MFTQPHNQGHERALSDISRRVELVRNAFDAGLDCEEGVFVHGTSLTCVEHAIKTGRIPPGVQPQTGNYFYFLPLPSRISHSPQGCILPTTDEAALDDAMSYAVTVSRRGEVLRHFGLSHQNAAHWEAAETLFDINLIEKFDVHDRFAPLRRCGVDMDTARRLVQELEDGHWGRVVLLLSKKLSETFRVEEAEDNDEGLRIDVPEGIPIEYIVGIEASTAKGFHYFQNLTEERITIGSGRESSETSWREFHF